MYDIVSELNASKTQVFKCKQDCGRYLSFHCHMKTHSCEHCSCFCFECLSSKDRVNDGAHITSKSSDTASKSVKDKALRTSNDHQWLRVPLWIILKMLLMMFRLSTDLLISWLLLILTQLSKYYGSKGWCYNC